MIYLILATACSASIAVLFKVSESRGNNRYVVSMMNYIVASSIALYFIIAEDTLKEFIPSIENHGIEASQSNFVVIIGIITGLFFLLGFIFYQKSVYESGASLASMFGKLGILLPMILSLLIWSEYPTPIQWGGIVLALAAIIMVNLTKKSDQLILKRMSSALLLLFIFGGLGDFCNKIFQKYALVNLKPIFLFFVFGTALVLSVSMVLIKKIKVKKEAVWIGAVVGIPNLFASFFLIEALRYKAATVVFPVYSAGSILIVILVSKLFFKEELNTKDKIAMFITVLSLFFIQ